MIIRNHTRLTGLNRQGFTLVELLIAMAITGFISTATYVTFRSQNKSYIVQDQVSEMQQNLRAGMLLMTREIRMAGYDPQGVGGYVVLASAPNSFNFTADRNDDGGAPGARETFLFQLYDTDADGTNDALRRTPGGSAIAENIFALDFVYLGDSAVLGDGIDNDGDGMTDESRTDGIDNDSDGQTDEADEVADENVLPFPIAIANLKNIRAVQITMVGRTRRIDKNYVDRGRPDPINPANPRGYFNQQNTLILAATNDNFRRKLITTTVNCRNLGL